MRVHVYPSIRTEKGQRSIGGMRGQQDWASSLINFDWEIPKYRTGPRGGEHRDIIESGTDSIFTYVSWHDGEIRIEIDLPDNCPPDAPVKVCIRDRNFTTGMLGIASAFALIPDIQNIFEGKEGAKEEFIRKRDGITEILKEAEVCPTCGKNIKE